MIDWIWGIFVLYVALGIFAGVVFSLLIFVSRTIQNAKTLFWEHQLWLTAVQLMIPFWNIVIIVRFIRFWNKTR